ncbi:glycosyltransferase [Chryseosolibacter indicus]|uniref:Glycosyltransferase n=1 Tax=Chryseosolibacter indicus TaxID=2782351 RepID=A0ABS5VVZ6_9BACT|nr:glycosyltransferase [Chryseosolibacter indicus]MBT1704899.1 glycosyltransferase [Chryseosolibacter indicus]
MKILHVLTSPRAEGTPRLVLDWLSVKDYEQEVLFLTAKGELKENFQKHCVWQYYNESFPLRVKNFAKVIRLVKNTCKARKPDIVIAWPLGFSHFIAIGAWLAGVKKNIAHAGNPAGESFVGRYIHSWLSFNIGNLFGNKVIACSDYVMESFKKIPFVPSANIFSVYNCANINRFILKESIERSANFIMVATLEKHKDHRTLLHAWKVIENAGVESKLLIVGDGSLRDQLCNLASNLGLKSVSFMGSRDDVPSLLHRNAFFILSTTSQEGFGTVLIEALAAGCLVIASDVPACREVLQNGKYGILTPVANAVQLATVLLQCLQNGYKKLSDKKLKEQIEYASLYTPEKMIERYLKIAEGS